MSWFSLSSAFPLSIDSFAILMPSSMLSAFPLIYNAQPALRTTMSLFAPFIEPLRMPKVILALSKASPPLISSLSASGIPKSSDLFYILLSHRF